MKLLLHCCCAPCSTSCLPALRGEGIEPDLFWYNPNIHPYGEYSLRSDSLIKFADNENLKLKMIDEYDLRVFLDAVLPETGKRCQKCYSLRLEKAALAAAQDGYNAFTTTLLVSPYQDHDAIKRIGFDAAEKYGVEFLYRDFRPFFREGQQRARTAELYMQKYCGCIFSEEERFHQKGKKQLNINIDEHPKKEAVPANDDHIFQRLELITGKEGLEKLKNTKVLVFGLGGVGSWAAEALVRSGIGKIGIIDSDTICASNVNRQVEATTLTIGKSKVRVLKKRLLEINPACEITDWNELFCREKASVFDIASADYVIDAIDSLPHKLDLIETVCGAGVTLFSSMGMALKIDPSLIKTASFWKTTDCPLARLVRQGLRKRGFSSDFTVVYSAEKPLHAKDAASAPCEKPANGSVVTVTATAGLFLANLVLRDITGL
ncbi:MAG: epoxyqueuosine reductase QueH [Treponema sp.]|jgi:tRNA A37 threonylcarbamoyladenosine dehydratase/predicted adenine nucleotide alpha hydrolase (AANH) superfamily ATPase|nr:epoxyqueuosine reductase QueH [Treponema sp.]